MLVYVSNDKKYYLTSDGKFVEDFRQLFPFECEQVSKSSAFHPAMFRLKCFNKSYLTSSEKGITLDEKKSDNNLIFQTWKNVHFLNSIISLDSEKKLSILPQIDESKIYPSSFMHPDSYIRFDNVLDTKLKELYVNGFCVMDLNLDFRSKELFEKCRYIIQNSVEKKSNSILKTDSCFQKLLCQIEIKNMMDDIYGKNNYHLTSFTSNKLNKFLNDFSDCWNVNYPYTSVKTPKLPAKTLSVQVMILLEDFTQENGGHEVRVYSHSSKTIPTKDSLSQTERYNYKITAKKGSVIFMLGKLWNQEVKNNQELLKITLDATFSSFDVAPKYDLKQYFVFKNEGLVLKDEKIMFSEISSIPDSNPPGFSLTFPQTTSQLQQIQSQLSPPQLSFSPQITFSTQTQQPQTQTQQSQTQTQTQPPQTQQLPSGIPNIFGNSSINTSTSLFDINTTTNPFSVSSTNNTGLFGTTTTTGNNSGGLFGTTTTIGNNSGGLFGTTTTTGNNSGGLFGQFGNTSTTNLFGNSTTLNSNPYGNLGTSSPFKFSGK